MTLQQFIDQLGTEKIAKLLRVTTSNVHSWRNLHSTPRPERAWQLIRLSHNALTWGGIYEPYVMKELKGKTLKVESDSGQLELKF